MEGTTFGRYQLIELLGRGGMGEVWRAHDTGTNRHVAIKVLPAELVRDGQFEARFRREADLAAALSSPHIVPIHDYGEIDGRLFVSMRLVEGHDLAAELARSPLSPERAVSIVEQVAKALRTAHRAGLVHRDVKPSNILIDDEGDAYLIDFGIARAVADTGLTGTGTTIGTWAYMAPERFHGGELDARVDVYALACVLYECLTGATPYPSDRFEQIATAHMFTPPPQPSRLVPGLAPELDRVIATGMAKDPNQRYPGARELAAAARHAINATIPPASPSPSAPPQFASAPHPAPPPPRPAVSATDPTQRRAPATSDDEPPRREPSPITEPTPKPSQRRRVILVAASIAAVMAVVVAGVVFTTIGREPAEAAEAPAVSLWSDKATILPFIVLASPSGVAVDPSGDVYVADQGNDRVLQLPVGSREQAVLPFSGLRDDAPIYPYGVAVDGARTVFVIDNFARRVLALRSGSTEQTVLPFSGKDPSGVAVDDAGAVYVADSQNNRVVVIPAGSNEQKVLPLNGLNRPLGVAVDDAGAVYVADSQNNRVVVIPAGSNEQKVLPLAGLDHPMGLAVDDAGAVYVADSNNNRVVMLGPAPTSRRCCP